MNILYSLPQPILFAHRGASAHAPENTLAAFYLAVEQKADAIELDAKLSADGEVVVIHDPTLDRTTGTPEKVNQMTLAELKALDAGIFFSEKYQGEKIPALGEVFEAVGKEVLINVELTNYSSPGDGLPEKVAQLVKKHGMEERVLFSSFNPLNLRVARKILPGVPVGILALEGAAGSLSRSWLGSWFAPDIVHPYLTDATEEFIQKQHHRGRRVHVWTVNDPSQMQALFDRKVDGIFTDDPMLARKVLAQE